MVFRLVLTGYEQPGTWDSCQNPNPASKVRLSQSACPEPPGPRPVPVIAPGGFLSARERAGFSGSPI